MHRGKKKLEWTFPRAQKAAKTWKTSQSRNINKAKMEKWTLANWKKESQFCVSRSQLHAYNKRQYLKCYLQSNRVM